MKRKSYYSIGIIVVLAVYVFAHTAETRKAMAAVEQVQVENNPEAKRGKYTVTVRVRDDAWNKVRVESAVLENQDIPLQHKANLFGVKGTAFVRLNPGEYTLRWTITKPSSKGNRITLSFHKNVRVKKNDRLVVIRGQHAYIY
ncbi:MAG TPA: hypothetical protein VLG44_01945 [Chlamydiales bacterium]|nr:hypothetical protein [Chlamydiales bacterium]